MSGDFLPISVIMKRLGLKDRKSFRVLYILPALKENVIERKYPYNPNHPRQQYRLTVNALEWKSNQKGESENL